MKVAEIIAWLEAWSPIERENRSDALLYGDPDREVQTVAVSLLATPHVLRAAKEAGASMLLVHEPVLHSGVIPADDPVMAQKRAMIEEFDIPIYRFHDHAHFTPFDKINCGVLRRLGWEGEFDGGKRFTFARPTPIAEVIDTVRHSLSLRHLRYIGPPSLTVRRVATLFGAWGERNIYDALLCEDVDLVLAGEACEWSLCEYARDAVELGRPRGLLLMGHMGSESAGMLYIADALAAAHPTLSLVRLECGETFSPLPEICRP